jgi:hypothetical protein
MKKWIIGGIAAGGVLAVIAVAIFYLVAYVILSTFIFGPPPLSPAAKKQIFENFYQNTSHNGIAILPLSRPYVLLRSSSRQWHMAKAVLDKSIHYQRISSQVFEMNMYRQFLVVKLVQRNHGGNVYFWKIYNLSKHVDNDSENITEVNLKAELKKMNIPINIELKSPDKFYKTLKQAKRCHWFPVPDAARESVRAEK